MHEWAIKRGSAWGWVVTLISIDKEMCKTEHKYNGGGVSLLISQIISDQQ